MSQFLCPYVSFFALSFPIRRNKKLKLIGVYWRAIRTPWLIFARFVLEKDSWRSSVRRSCTWFVWGTPWEDKNGVGPGVRCEWLSTLIAASPKPYAFSQSHPSRLLVGCQYLVTSVGPSRTWGLWLSWWWDKTVPVLMYSVPLASCLL